MAPTPVTLAECFAWSASALMYAIGTRLRVGEMAVIGLALCRRIGRIRNQVVALIGQIEAGTLRDFGGRAAPAAPRPKMDEATRQRLAEKRKILSKLPRRPGWLLGWVPYEAAGYAAQIALLLQREDMQRHLAATPRLARLLRPLCRMLGIDLALLGEKPAERKPRRRSRQAGENGAADQLAGTGGEPARRRRTTRRAADGEPSRAEIKRILATRRWPSIEMQADPKRYPWYPQDEGGTGDGGEKSG